MKKKISNKLLQCLSLVLLAGIWGGCTDEREGYESPAGGNAQREVTFSVQVPGANQPDTYALTQSSENEVTQVAVLLFDAAGGYTYQPLWCNTITSSGTNGSTKEFTVKIPEGTYSMMLLANANQGLSAALTAASNPISVGDSKAVVAGKVLQANTGKWIAGSSDPAYKAIPMWGEIPTTTVNSSLTAPINTILVRMLAKINVTLTSASAKASFKLKNIRLYNYNDRGQVAANTSTWTGTPSVPASAQKPAVPISSPLLYTAMTTADVACTNEIYTFEAVKGTAATHLNNTCLVVGGRYTGDAADSYYRIDFANTSGSTTTYLDLLRNHSYEVNISGVSSSGLPTPDEAFKSRTVKIQADILAWNDGGMSDVVSDGQHKLQVSKGEFTFTREARTASSSDNTLSITTDVPAGWEVLQITDASNNDVNIDTNPSAGWIMLNPNKKNNAGSVNTDIILKENTAGAARTAKIHINAGRLTYVVTVTQTTAAALSLTIRDEATNTIDMTELVFAAAAGVSPAAQSIRLSWMPVDKAVGASTVAWGGSNPFVYLSTGGMNTPGTGSETSYAGGTGSKTLNIRPPGYTPGGGDPFRELISKVDFTVNNGAGGYIAKSLFLRQKVYNMVPVVEDVYMMTGGQRSFAVRANAPFTVSLKSNPGGVISNLSYSGTPNTSATGSPVYFDIYNDFPTPALFQKEVVVTIKSVPQGLFPDTDVTLKCVSGIVQPKSNSYMVVPNGTPILIPVSRANESMLGAIQLGANEAFSADLLWTDKPHKTYPVEGLGANGAIQSIQAVGTGTGGYVLVIPGAGQGNAIVYIKNASSRILWSWHIWVTSYNPYDANGNAWGTGTGNNWMDRNLGAVTNTPGLVTTKGLLYQWGRKDAFPGSSSINGNVEGAIYSKTAQFAIVKMAVPAASNFVNSVGNPSTFYYGTAGNAFDWYSNSTNTHNDGLWGHGTGKTVYDPCPAGWRVPQNGVWNSLTPSNFPWNTTTLGRNNASVGGFYPASGGRGHTDGQLYAAGVYGEYWSGSPSVTYAFCLSFSSSYTYPGNNLNRSYGFAVRCVRE